MSGRPSHRLAQPLQHIALHLIAIRAVELDGANVHRVCVDGPLRVRTATVADQSAFGHFQSFEQRAEIRQNQTLMPWSG